MIRDDPLRETNVPIFGKDEPSGKGPSRAAVTEATLTIIAASTTVSGDIDCSGVLKVEGRIDGSVRGARQVMLAREGAISGDVTANEVVVGGVIEGNVTASDRLELQNSAVVNGDIATKSIVVMEGARINGGVKMTELTLMARPGEARDGRDSRVAR
ncbi:MAG: polymer-forming cytoskeletal protein [Gemmatimonadaceae bacterium]